MLRLGDFCVNDDDNNDGDDDDRTNHFSPAHARGVKM